MLEVFERLGGVLFLIGLALGFLVEVAAIIIAVLLFTSGQLDWLPALAVWIGGSLIGYGCIALGRVCQYILAG